MIPETERMSDMNGFDSGASEHQIAKQPGVSASDIHLGGDASETTVKRAPLADYRIVYFATHGATSRDWPSHRSCSLSRCSRPISTTAC
jgi:hypothetical protein